MSPSQAVLRSACEALTTRDPVLAQAYSEIGIPVWRTTKPNYETLARAVVYQLISTKAAAAIWSRVAEHFRGEVFASRVLASADERLRDCGLSRPKVRYMKSIAGAVESKKLCFERLQTVDAETAYQELINVTGIGAWTAELFLMNALGHVDAFPVGDVGIMEAYRILSEGPKRHNAKDFNALAEQWRPYRGVAAHLLWGWLNVQREVKAT